MTHRLAVPLILLISCLVGGVWAAILPAWDLNDEQQHVDYVQGVSETGKLPILGERRLSLAITESVIATDRWSHLRLRRPASMDPTTWGLEGESYQSYQPPLYYVLLVAPYRALSESTLVALYGLRVISIGLAALSALVTYFLLLELTGSRSELAFIGASALILIPERAQASSRVNNDMTMELFGAMALLLIIQQWKTGPTWKRSTMIGLVVGLALLSKSSAAILVLVVSIGILMPIQGTPISWRLRHFTMQILVIVLVSGWQIGRNILLYGDPTGAAAFLRLSQFHPTLRFPEVILALGQGLWITRWQGVVPLSFAVACWTLLLLNMLGLIGSRRHLRYSGLLAATAVLWIVPLIYGASTGLIQTVEGRFLLGALPPLIALAAMGAANMSNHGRSRVLLSGLAATFGFANVATLVLFALPYYYQLDLTIR